MKAKQIYEFTRGNDPLDTLGIGYTAKIHKFFDDLEINRDDYSIEGKQIIFNKYLNLNGCKNLVELPNNLTVDLNLGLCRCTSLLKLPNNLVVKGSIFLRDTNIVELPKDFWIGFYIYVDENQTELINWIKSSKFKTKFYIT